MARVKYYDPKSGTWKYADTASGPVPEVPSNAVLYTPQTLTPEQQKQARDNVGAVSAAEVTEIVNEALGVIENGSY